MRRGLKHKAAHERSEAIKSPLADSFVRMPGGGVYLSNEGRTSLIKAWEAHKEAEIYHAISDRQIGRWALPSVQATLLARHLRGDLPAYPPFVMP